MAVLTDKQETLIRTISITGVSTHRASLARVVGVYLDCHTPSQERFRGNHALEFSKRPLGVGGVGFPLLFAHSFAFLVSFAARSALSDVCQKLQSDQTVGILGHDAFRDSMIGVLLQPSLSSANHHQTAG